MTISPDRDDFFTIFNILGRLALGLSGCMLLPFFIACIYNEYSALFDFTFAITATASAGLFLIMAFPLKSELTLVHAFFVVSLGWIVASLVGAVPLFCSEHYQSFLDAWFEAMSGFATTGLSLVKDLDHMSYAHNMWRHLMMFLGGQGITLASISLLTQVKGGAWGLYVGEARTEKILPNIIATARFIWQVSMIYLVCGVCLLGILFFNNGMAVDRALLHGLWIFFASFDTGGFAPHTQSINYYHSRAVELVTLLLMMMGAINFNVHFHVWFRQKKEIFKNFEMRTFLVSLLTLFFVFNLSLHLNPFQKPHSFSIFRMGMFQLISAHTGCGFTNLVEGELGQLNHLALLAIVFAMMIGGGMCSTTGGIKLLRVGIILKAFLLEIKRWMMPVKAVYKDTYHHLREVILDDRKIRGAFIFFSFFLATYLAGGLVGILYGYPALPSLFESVSAAANVGLSLGINKPLMPTGLKITYNLQMWLGRLEFIAVFVSIGFIFSLFKK